jgi:hypothetical protein
MSVIYKNVSLQIDRAMAQAVSRLPLNGPCGIRGEQSGSKTGFSFSTCFGFILSVMILTNAPYSSAP